MAVGEATEEVDSEGAAVDIFCEVFATVAGGIIVNAFEGSIGVEASNGTHAQGER